MVATLGITHMKRLLKRYAGDILSVLLIALVVAIYFYRFFWPETQLLFTPDFGRSDAWHFSFATKFALAESLARGQLPLWEPRMGMGFPLFAEGQVGTLFLPNLLLMSLPGLTGLNPVIAYNITYVILFLTLGWGMYAWLRVIGCSRLASLFGAVTITFSGQTIPRLPHHTLLQSLTMTPILMALTHLMIVQNNPFWMSLFTLALSQQFFTGSPQPVLLTLFLMGIYTVLMGYRQGLALSLARFGRLAIGVILAVGIAAIQILPSREMLSQSTAPQGFSPEEASYYSFPLVHLKTLIDPFILGNPKDGSYPPFTTFDGSIFWENNLFIGWITLILLLLSLSRYYLERLTLSRILLYCIAAGAASFLLMLGKHSPVYLIYSIWPLNLFRVPSRFAWIFVLALITAVSWLMTQWTATLRSIRWRKVLTVVFGLLFALQTYHLISTWWNYHALRPARLALTPTPFLQKLQQKGGALRTLGVELMHNKQFLKTGWTPNADMYEFLTNVPSPNGNLYWGLTQSDVYAGRFLKRSSLVESLLGSEIKLSEEIATISAQGKRLLDLYHASTIVSAIPLDSVQELGDPESATYAAGITITAYRNNQALPRAYLASHTLFAPSLTKAAELLKTPSFIPGENVIVHDSALILPSVDAKTNTIPSNGSVTMTSDQPASVSLRAVVTVPQAILVLADTYYPGWVATVDGIPTPIYPVNIKERGIRLAKGTHEILWTYEPASYRWGLGITVITLVLTLLLPVGYHLSAARLRTSA